MPSTTAPWVSIIGKNSMLRPVMLLYSAISPIFWNSWFKSPLFSRMVIHEYVRSRKLIHMGSMISTMAIRWKAAPSRLMKYATG